MNRPVTFDFDDTLAKPIVQEYCKALVERGVDVWILTSRYDMLNIHRYADVEHHNHEDLWKVCEYVGIPRHKVIFTNFTSKAEYLRETNVLWHLDDNYLVLSEIKHKSPKTFGIQVNSGMWKSKCERILKK